PRIPDHLARRRDLGQRAAPDRLEHCRGRRHRHRGAHPDLLAFRAALHRARSHRRSRQMNYDSIKPELIAENLGWPEGPTVMPDGSVTFVESYRSQLTVAGAGKPAKMLAYTAGAPNSCVLGADGELYVCQNGGTVGPWRAAEMSVPSIQKVRPGGK